MTPVIQFDMCAVIIVAVIFFSVIFRKMTKGIQNQFFMLLVAMILVDTIFDLWAVAEDTRPDPENCSIFIRYLSHTGYLILRNLTIPVYTLFLISLTDTWHKLKKSLLHKIILIVPCSIVLTMLALNPLTKLMFYINNDYAYTRGPLFPIVYASAIIYVALGLSYIIRYRELFHGGKLASLVAIYPLTLAAAAIQWINPSLLVELFFNSVALMLITITIQRPEELIDSTTGLGKYAAYASTMKRNFTNEKHVGIILINTSNFSSIRNMLGYDFSSEFLKMIAEKLSILVKDMKLHADIFYLDNGRFRIIVNERNWDMMDNVAEKINSFLKENVIFNQLELNLIAYVSIVYCPNDVSDFKSLISYGNELCNVPFTGRVIKASEILGNNNFHLNHEIDAIIDDALAAKKFSVYYQPIYSVEKQRFISAEALLRLTHEKYGFIPPDVFIAAAERSGAIHRIGDYVLEEVCRFIASDEFRDLGLSYIEINLSVAQCMQADLADKVLRIMEKYSITPDKINLEITETVASYTQNILMNNLDKLTQAGVKFSLDDYGTGYSNIRSVASLPITIVKLDKTFVDEEDNPRMWIVLKNTIKMLKDMDMRIVVEGVENAELARKFAELNCEYIQGYYYSKPIPKQDFIEFMKKQAQ